MDPRAASLPFLPLAKERWVSRNILGEVPDWHPALLEGEGVLGE